MTYFTVRGKCSWFGGPKDTGVSPSEGLALYDHSDVHKLSWLFLAQQPPHTTGVARRLNPNVPYIACRWNYEQTPRDWLRKNMVQVASAKKPDTFYSAHPVDWGPNEDTGRIADLSPGLIEYLGLETDDEVIIRIPLP